jgi:hypothetical protein
MKRATRSTASNPFHSDMVRPAGTGGPPALVLNGNDDDDDRPNYEVVDTPPSSPGGRSVVLKQFSGDIGREEIYTTAV